MISQLISRLMILVFGTLYPAYCSYKAVKTKDVREYVKWMMYWIVFAFFTALENAADLLISWLPLYYEIKIAFLIWLLSPATKGSSILYRKFVHPWLARHEKEIDKYIASAKESSYTALLRVGKQGINVATDTFLKTAVTGQNTLMNTLKKYSSMQDLHRTENLDAVDGRQVMPSRVTWHGEPSGQEPIDDPDYNFDDDYRILEQQYHHEDPAGNTLPGGAMMPRTRSLQNTIPETQIESDEDSVEDSFEDANEDDDQSDDEYVPPKPVSPKKQKSRSTSSSGNNDARKRKSAPKSSSADVSQMRGYSTLPRSRTSKASAVPEPNYGGTLPRASRRRPKMQIRSKEA